MSEIVTFKEMPTHLVAMLYDTVSELQDILSKCMKISEDGSDDIYSGDSEI